MRNKVTFKALHKGEQYCFGMMALNHDGAMLLKNTSFDILNWKQCLRKLREIYDHDLIVMFPKK